jgi:hypothetical protein
LVPPRYRRQAEVLLQQFNKHGNELTWNSDGVIFIDQISLPNSDIFVLFPYLFKSKHPKDLNGFEDFLKKINEMGLTHLIVSKHSQRSNNLNSSLPSTSKSQNWWFLG